MKITVESTSKLVMFKIGDQDVPARIWEGETEGGIPVHCYITRICPSIAEPLPEAILKNFAAELQEQKAPTPAIQAIPLRMIL